ncbi:unnamed protein product [Lactuca virosa]|uniref:Uncharacterized protein n=1 Tax=Lactuca virosa TaxID=75947 RepID=A0AAU9M2I1_9ASTR|nr:unnamed protein product [Lactuca virosa]CAH1434258.1 unnamed protein product [Lactuca virosa]
MSQPMKEIEWIKIIWVPIYLRAEENYTTIASNFSKVLQVDGHNWGNINLSYGTTCILPTEITRINGSLTYVDVDSTQNNSDSGSGDDEDSEGISNTWENNLVEDELEEGEIEQDEVNKNHMITEKFHRIKQ